MVAAHHTQTSTSTGINNSGWESGTKQVTMYN